jgi:hypothetical protein
MVTNGVNVSEMVQDSLGFRTVFDILNVDHAQVTGSLGWWQALLFWTVINSAAFLTYGGKLRRGLRWFQLFSTVGLVLVVSWSRQNQHIADLELSALKRERLSGEFHIIERIVEDFTPGKADGHPPEQFRVGNTHFTYSPYEITSAFHQVVENGGPLRNGLKVRIAETDGKILRLEIAQ